MEPKIDIELPLLQKKGQESTKAQYSSFLEFVQINYEDRYTIPASLLAFYTFYDVLGLVKQLNKSKAPIQADQLPGPNESEYKIEEYIVKLDQKWEKQLLTRPKQPSLLQALKENFLVKWKKHGLLIFWVNIVQLTSTLFLGKIISLVTQHNIGLIIPYQEALFYAFGFCLAYMISQYSETFCMYFGQNLSSATRLSLMGLIYKKLNCVALSSLQKINVGKVINLMSNELVEIDSNGQHLWPLILSPLHLGLGFVLIWLDFSYFTVVVIVIQIIIMWLTTFLSDKSKSSRTEKNKISDSRIKLTNEMVEWSRFMKLYSWEKPLREIVSYYRQKEVEQYIQLAKVEATVKPLGEITVNICIFFLLLTYILFGGVLTAEKVFFVMTILNFLKRKVLIPAGNGRIFYVNLKLMLKRTEEILEVEEIQHLQGNLSPLKSKGQNTEYIAIKDLTARWTHIAPFCLKNLTATISYGKITSVIGKIGSGKTSLLLAFLKEIPEMSGTLDYQGRTAYVEQDPIVFSLSFRDNILFGRDFDQELYKQVLKACCLEEDLGQLDHGDQTIVGEKGITLSGGQKARLSLARAIYSQSDIYLLDDPLSAVDSKVAKMIFEKALKGLLADKTVILVTHHLDFAKRSDKLVVMDEGSIVFEGSYNELQGQNLPLFKYFPQQQEEIDDSTRNEFTKGTNKEVDLSEPIQKLEEERPVQCTWSTYLSYFKEGKQYCLGFLTLMIYIICSTLSLAFTRVIGLWADANLEASLQGEQGTQVNYTPIPYIIACSLMLVGIGISFYLKMLLTAKFFFLANSVLHDKMLFKISRAQVSFFDRTPSGRVINRFSGDMAQLDRRLYLYVFDFLTSFFDWIVVIGYLSVKTAYLMIPTVIVVLALYWLRVYFTKPLIQMKNLELASTSPIFSDINSTIHGLVIVRVYRQSTRFVIEFLNKIYNAAKVTYSSARVNRLFALALVITIYAMIVSALFLFIWMVYFSQLESGLFGMAIYNLIAIGLSSAWMIRQTLFIEQAMQSVERILEYCKLEEEPPEKGKLDKDLDEETANSWPDKGMIKFSNVFLKYPGAKQYALSGISFKIMPGSKIGIVGRTGAGKSSILQALFRMTEINDLNASSIEIDGTNITQIGLEYLRKNICIIPQTAIIFNGSIKRNLDPFEDYSDDVIWGILDEINLKDYVESLPQQLETEVSSANSIFSAGQRQLICLGRVLLKRSKILVLDEATANVDIETDDFIQKKIREKFPDSTILTIAHRLTTIADYDKVMVLDKGKMVEFDHPYALLVKKIGDTKIGKRIGQGIFVDMVLKTGNEVSSKIFEIAKTTYFLKYSVDDRKPAPLASKDEVFKQRQSKMSIMRSNSFAPFFS